MTLRHDEWRADRKAFLKLLTDHDPYGPIPVAIRLDLTPEQVAAIAPGITDFDGQRDACQTFVWNFLAPEVDRMQRHLEWKAGQ